MIFVCIFALDDQRPKLQDFESFLTDYSKYWRDTGLGLGLTSSVLDQVEADYHTQSERFRATLDKWLNVGVTWANLELAITNANRNNLGLQPLMTISKENIMCHYLTYVAAILAYYILSICAKYHVHS